MRFPWANILLLIFLFLELVSGFFGLTSGSEERAFHIQIHRIAGYGILVVGGWKVLNVLKSLRWPRTGSVRVASLALVAGLVATMALGLVWSVSGSYRWWLFSGMSWHIYAGAAIIPLLAWHSWYMLRKFPIAFWIERRLILRALGLAAAGFIGWQLVERTATAAELPGSGRRFTGSYDQGRFTGNAFPRVSWLNDSPSPVDADRWRLSITGSVDYPTTLAYDDLERQTEATATLDCTGGWHTTQQWSGVRLADILDLAGPSSQSRSVVVRSVTGYYRRYAMRDVDGLILATHVTGERLSHGHGFPIRLVAPGRRGFEWVKWVTEIEVDETPAWWQPPLPLQ